MGTKRRLGENLSTCIDPQVQIVWLLNLLKVNSTNNEFYGQSILGFLDIVKDRFYQLSKVETWTATSNGKTYLTGLKATFTTRGEISGWPEVIMDARDPDFSYGTATTTWINDYQLG